MKRMVRYSTVWSLLWLLSMHAGHPVAAQSCVQEVVCVEPQQVGNSVNLYVRNQSGAPVVLALDATLQNMQPSVPLPLSRMVPPGGPHLAVRLRTQNAGGRVGYRYRFNWKPAFQADRECAAPEVCMIREQRGDTLRYLIDNRLPGPVSMRFRMRARNVRFSVQMPHTMVFPSGQTTYAFEGLIEDPFAAWSSTADWTWSRGDATAVHDARTVYVLPYRAGEGYRVMQGYNGTFSHRGVYALDFDVPRGYAVRAARGGVVVATEDQYGEGGPEPRFRDQSNYVHILHDDGTTGIYVHLQQNGVRVQLGQRVVTGQVLGLAGNSGYSTGPHLHFEVRRLRADLESETVPVRFRTSDGILQLEEGKMYVSD